MKKTNRWGLMVIGVLALLVCIMLMPGRAYAYLNAEDLQEINEKWMELRDYPMKPGALGWDRLNYEEILKVVNPPRELIDSMSTRELADLMLHNPLLEEMHGFGAEEYFSLFAGKSAIYEELRWRKDGNVELLNAWRDIEPEMNAELFVNAYVSVFGSEFTKEEIALYDEIWNERNEKYYQQFPENSYGLKHVEIKASQADQELPSASELWKRWRDCNEYPIMPGDENWDRFDDDRKFRLLNPPDDVLKEMSSEELARLAMTYPYIKEYYEFHDTARQFFHNFLEKKCKIFKELIEREDGTASLLRAYEANEPNIGELNEKGLDADDPSVVAEFFICRYVDYYSTWRFHESDIALYREIYQKKSATYEKITDETVRDAFTTKLSKAMAEEGPQETEGKDAAKDKNVTGDTNGELTENKAEEQESQADVPSQENQADLGKILIIVAIVLTAILLVAICCTLLRRRGK